MYCRKRTSVIVSTCEPVANKTYETLSSLMEIYRYHESCDRELKIA